MLAQPAPKGLRTPVPSAAGVATEEWSEKMADLDRELEGLRAAANRHAARYQVI